MSYTLSNDSLGGILQWNQSGPSIYYNAGNVGIGNASPSYKLDVSGDINFTGTLRQNGTAFGGSQWTTSGTAIYYTTGNVGIGTATNLTNALTVNGIVSATTFSGSAASLTSFPTLNQNTTGTAGNVTGTVAIANGGTGSTTAQTAINALAGAVTSAQFLRGNGANVVMSAIQVADVPTLNQNTSGSAGSATTATQLGGLTKSQLWNNSGQNHTTYPRFESLNTVDYGNYFVQDSNDSPIGGLSRQFYVVNYGLGNDYPYSQFAMQTAIRRNVDGYFWFRFREYGAFGDWKKIYAGFADSATTATNQSGGSVNATSITSSGTIQSSNNPVWNVSKFGQANQSGTITYSTLQNSRNVTIILGSGTVQVPIAGYYQLNFHGFTDSTSAGGLFFRNNGSTIMSRNYSNESSGQYRPISISVVAYFNTNDILEVFSEIVMHGNDNCNFSGHLIA